MPLWILLNSFCKTIWNDFLLLQFVVAFLSIAISAYFIKKTCPSLRFFVLLCYFIGKFSSLQMELLRESLAVAFFLLALLELNKENIKKSIVFSCFAVLFHVFAIVPVLFFWAVYFFLPRKQWIHVIIFTVVLLITIASPSSLVKIIEQNAFLLDGFDSGLSSTVVYYATSDKYGSINKSISQYISIISQFVVYIYMFYRFKKEYQNYILLKPRIFEVGVFIFIIMLLGRFSFTILYRIGNSYLYFWGCMLAVVWTKIILKKIKRKDRVLAYLAMLLIPVVFALNVYLAYFSISGMEMRWYKRYYPYSSVFDKTIIPEREQLHNSRGVGYSHETDY